MNDELNAKPLLPPTLVTIQSGITREAMANPEAARKRTQDNPLSLSIPRKERLCISFYI